METHSPVVCKLLVCCPNEEKRRIDAEINLSVVDFEQLLTDAAGAKSISEVSVQVLDSEDEDGKLVAQQVAPVQLLSRCTQWLKKEISAPFKGKAWNQAQKKLTIHVSLKQPSVQLVSPEVSRISIRKDHDRGEPLKRSRSYEQAAINKAVRDNVPYNLDSSLKNPRVLIAKDIQREPHLQPVWDKCFAAGFAQVADLQPRVTVDCFKKKWQKYATDYNAQRARYEKVKATHKEELACKPEDLEKKPWKKLWNKESRAAWRSFKYAQPDNPDAGPSERRIAMEDMNVTDRQQELINALLQRKQIESSKTSFTVPATPVPVGAGGTAQHTPGLGALELPKGTTKSGRKDEPPGTQDGRTSQRQKQPANGEDALMMVLAANAARIHQKEKEIKAARRRQAKSSEPSKARNSSRNATNSSKAAAKKVTNNDDVRPSTKVRRTSTGIKKKVPVEDKSTDGDDNNDSYDHRRKKVKSASEDVRCTRARRQRGSSGSKKKQELLQEEVSKDEKSEDEQDDATSAREDDDNEDSEIEDD
ncbi:hypothetical protein VaNZ11_002378 [Volvox africanus]|uniref:HMG box domain-containing protein n=1 Tax=Volvox africanus TaxID=51714 RepID=A0ABQ5RSJ3_9CHLO|nr:hypothetical protein VaNZ11_002378 [Volvox africanus]